MTDSDSYGPSRLPPAACDLCGDTEEKLFPVFSGGDVLKLCALCKAEVAGGE